MCSILIFKSDIWQDLLCESINFLLFFFTCCIVLLHFTVYVCFVFEISEYLQTEMCYSTVISCSYIFLTFAYAVIYINLGTYCTLDNVMHIFQVAR